MVRGRVQKKRGLSRHYPHKAQSFDCISSLFLAASCSATPESSVLLSKSLSARCGSLRRLCSSQSSPSFEQLTAALPRVASGATIHECPHEETCSLIEHSLCAALQEQATLEGGCEAPASSTASRISAGDGVAVQ